MADYSGISSARKVTVVLVNSELKSFAVYLGTIENYFINYNRYRIEVDLAYGLYQ